MHIKCMNNNVFLKIHPYTSRIKIDNIYLKLSVCPDILSSIFALTHIILTTHILIQILQMGSCGTERLITCLKS